MKGRAANLLMRGETWSTFLATDWEKGDLTRENGDSMGFNGIYPRKM